MITNEVLLCSHILLVDFSRTCPALIQRYGHYETLQTSSGREFHGFTTLTAKLFRLISSRDDGRLSFSEWPLVDVL